MGTYNEGHGRHTHCHFDGLPHGRGSNSRNLKKLANTAVNGIGNSPKYVIE
jgi:hypothetical protein